MVDPIFYLIALFICFSYPTGTEPLVLVEMGRSAMAIASIATILIYAILCAVLYLRLKDTSRVSMLRFYLRFIGLVFFAVIIYICNYILIIDSLSFIPNSILIKGFIYLLPYLLLSAINTCLSILKDIKRTGRSFRETVEFLLRMFFGLVVLPILVMFLFIESFEQIKPLEKLVIVYPITGIFCMLVLSSVIFVFSPFLIRLSFHAKRIESGALEESLAALCKKANLRHAGILVIPTKGAPIANAFVTGIFPSFRYIFVTEHLINNMTEKEIEGVVAHEISHVTRKHMISYLAFMLCFVSLSVLIQEIGTMATGEEPSPWIIIGVFIFVWIILFGVISKRFESEADIYGAKLSGSYEETMNALNKVADLNRISRKTRSLRHYSIETRNLILFTCLTNPNYEDAFLKIVQEIKRVLALSAAASIFFLIIITVQQIQSPAKNMERYNAIKMLREGKELVDRREYVPAKKILNKAVDMKIATASTHYLLGVAQNALGDKKDALGSFLKAIDIGLQDPYERINAKRSVQEIQNEQKP